MSVTVQPTLDLMSEIYCLPRQGGAESARFRRYVEVAGSGHPVHAYNPMTGNPAALETVNALRAIDAESLAERVLGAFGELEGLSTSVAVLTPGFWTDRYFTEVRNRRDGAGVVWFWAGEEVDEQGVMDLTTVEAIRMIWRIRHGPPASLREFAAMEAVALNAVGFERARADEAVEDILEVLGDEEDDHTLIAYVFGDEEAESAGWRPLGLSGDEGPRTVAGWLADYMSWSEALDQAWAPTRHLG